jgi:hypothetical protein
LLASANGFYPEETPMQISLIIAAMLFTVSPAAAQWGNTSPRIYAPNGQPLGTMNNNRFDPNSINNPYGRYGSPYGNNLNNPYSPYGFRNSLSPQSPSYPYGR